MAFMSGCFQISKTNIFTKIDKSIVTLTKLPMTKLLARIQTVLEQFFYLISKTHRVQRRKTFPWPVITSSLTLLTDSINFSCDVEIQHVPRIGPWEIQHIRVFLGILFVVDALYMILFHENLDRFSDRVRKGELDLLLTKPVDTQIFVSLQKISWALIGNLTIATAFLIWALLPWGSSLNGLRLLAGLHVS